MANAASDKPTRAAGLEVNEVGDGLVVYQESPERVHYLNNTASLVFEFCTGENSVTRISELVRVAFELDLLPEVEVMSCIEQLREQGLLR